jgi:hypothetical protein
MMAVDADGILRRRKYAFDFSPPTFPAAVCTFANPPSLRPGFIREASHGHELS